MAKNVHEGNCLPNECDPEREKDGTVIHTARSLWQLHLGGQVSHSDWNAMFGSSLEATKVAAWAAAKTTAVGYYTCNKDILGTFSYFSGRGCESPKAIQRHNKYQTLMNTPLYVFQRRVEMRKRKYAEIANAEKDLAK